MTQKELPNNSLKTDNQTPNAPFHYAVAGSQGFMLAAVIMLLLYFIAVVAGLMCGLGWGSLFLPILIYNLLLGVAMMVIRVYTSLITWWKMSFSIWRESRR